LQAWGIVSPWHRCFSCSLSLATICSIDISYAYRSRKALALNSLEVYEAKAAIMHYAATAGVGVLSALIALLVPDQGSLAGVVYFLVARRRW
jgi:hypothetical protein